MSTVSRVTGSQTTYAFVLMSSIHKLTYPGNRLLARVCSSRYTFLSLLTISYRYLEREELTSFPKASIVLLRPSMSFMLMNSPDPLTLKEVLPNFSGTTHVFLPINDNVDVTQAEGGSHWSLLLVSIIDGVSFHYDSMSNSNDREARSTTVKLEELLGKKLRYIPMLDSPQQENGSDCGVFVCVLMKHLLLKRLLRADASRKISMSMKDTHVQARDGRKTMLKIIEERKKEGERRRS
jgi:sentrin-specific protease 8